MRQDLLARMQLMQSAEEEQPATEDLTPEQLHERRLQQLAETNEFLAGEIERGTPPTEEQERLSQRHWREFAKALET
ncbi:MAG: hypothetical protein AB1758_31525 [Candidatus Eremiobacterota bacterium]